MGKKGKARQDKFYHLAKETGYRSRASFKLLQLNRRYEFLQKGRVLIDLCAAPGSWMQVARQHMPVSSLIVGIDLFPIKPIPGCIALQEDITTEQCRQALKRELKTWKADIVLHDGAPNVGQNWIHDAFMQSQLVLSALKLATEFLAPNGWFVTKIFRSKDYHALLWVLQQLFKKIHSTKPQASRMESAEIFVVCQGFKAPDKLDPKFLDPKYVFKEIEATASKSLALQTSLTKKKAEGYEDGVDSLHKSVSVKDFFFEEDRFLELLSSATELVLDDERILKHPLTNSEIVECCKDIKVLGRKELKSLLNWRKAIKTELDKEKENANDTKSSDAKTPDESVMEDEEEDEDAKELDAIDRQVEELQAEREQELKRKKKKILKERRKLQAKMALKMMIAGDSGPSLQDGPMFSLNQIKSAQDLATVAGDGLDVHLPSDEDEEERKPLPKYAKYDKEDKHLDKSGRFYRNEEDSDESEAPSEDEYESDGAQHELGLESDGDKEETDSEEDSPKSKGKKSVRFADTKHVQSKKKKADTGDDDGEVLNPLITDLEGGDAEQRKRRRAQLWFDKDVFENLENEDDEDAELDLVLKKQRQETFKQAAALVKNEKRAGKKDQVTTDGELSQDSAKLDEEDTEDESDTDRDDSDSDDSDTDSGLEQDLADNKKKGGDTFEVVPQQAAGKRKKSLPPEALALGQKLIRSKKARRDILDDGWNRYAFEDDNLPEWFVEDERRHNKKELPVSKAEVDAYRQRLKEINVRPIKKVVEAKARKKRRVLRMMEKAKKKVQNIAETMGNSDYDKAQQIRQIYRKAAAAANKKPDTKYVVARKGSQTGKRARRPAGVDGKYKMVDLRMKKDNKRAKKEQRRGRHGKKKR